MSIVAFRNHESRMITAGKIVAGVEINSVDLSVVTADVLAAIMNRDNRNAAVTAPGTPGNETYDGVHRTSRAAAYWVDHMRDAEDAFGSSSESADTENRPNRSRSSVR